MHNVVYDPNKDYYTILEVEPDATDDEIKSCYRRLAKETHPDLNGGSDTRFKEVGDAYEVLIDHTKRQEYDESWAAYIAGLPPILRLSRSVVDFGTRAVGDGALKRRIVLFNDGGDAECQVIPESGSFWSVVGASSVDEDAWGELIFAFETSGANEPGRYEDDVKVLLDNGKDISAQHLHVRARLDEATVTAPSGPGVRSKPTPAPPHHACPTCSKSLTASGFCSYCYDAASRRLQRRFVAITLAILIGLIGVLLVSRNHQEPSSSATTVVSPQGATAGDTESPTAPPTTQPALTIEKVGWPTSAQDGGSAAMNAYFGASLEFPDWVACEVIYCLVGLGDSIAVYKQRPVEELGTFSAHVSSPYKKLRSIRFTDRQARDLLARGNPAAETAPVGSTPPPTTARNATATSLPGQFVTASQVATPLVAGMGINRQIPNLNGDPETPSVLGRGFSHSIWTTSLCGGTGSHQVHLMRHLSNSRPALEAFTERFDSA